MRSRIFIWLIALIAILLHCNELDAYSTKVHRKLTEKIIDLNIQSLNNYLKNIGLPKGVTESVNNRFVRRWIEDGSYDEDYNWDWWKFYDPLYSHFYNPLTNTSGVGNLTPSAYDWANDSNNSWSWQKARDNFYNGLTLTTKTDREKALADAFSAIGHVIHLVEDMAVPAHTRADLHASLPGISLIVGEDGYEKYTNTNIANLNYTSVFFPYWNISISAGAPKQFWDLDSYNGTTPYYTGYIGLAEYTNANFFSEDTIFKNFPHPAKENTTARLVEQTAKDGKTDKVWYIQGYTSEKLAAYSYFIKNGLPPTSGWAYNLDDYVHKDYAGQLIPRAVGYSAGLLDYFFRGEMDMIKDPNNSSQYIIKNLSNENMFGTFSLYYDDTNNNRYLVASWGNLAINANSQSSSVTFTAPSSPVPKEKGKYILVFQGTFGNEIGAVIGMVVEGLCAGQWVLVSSTHHCRMAYSSVGVHCWEISGNVLKEMNFWGYKGSCPSCPPLLGEDDDGFPIYEGFVCSLAYNCSSWINVTTGCIDYIVREYSNWQTTCLYHIGTHYYEWQCE